jgi:hypothetical protein
VSFSETTAVRGLPECVGVEEDDPNDIAPMLGGFLGYGGGGLDAIGRDRL